MTDKRDSLPVAIRPVVVWNDQPEICKAVLGRTPRQLFKYEKQGLTTWCRGKGTGKRYWWEVDVVVAFLKATSMNSNEDSRWDDD